MCAAFPPADDAGFDITKALDAVDNIKGRPSVVIREQDVHTFLVTTFAFDQETARVGEPCRGQLSVTSYASKSSAPVTIDEIKILFETSLKPLTIRHSDESDQPIVCRYGTKLSKVVLKEEQHKRASIQLPNRRSLMPTILTGTSNLAFAPGETKVYEFTIPLREAENARALSATFTMVTTSFDLDYIVPFDKVVDAKAWWSTPHTRNRVVRPQPHTISILPKPPKMDIRFPKVKEQYYTDEAISIELDIFNGEDEDTLATLDVEVVTAQSSNPATPFKLNIPNSSDEEASSRKSVGKVSAQRSITASLDLDPITVQSIYEAIFVLKYTLASDPDTRITRTSAIRLNVGSPFEANYDFSPRHDDRPWPSFFDASGLATPPPEGAETDPKGLGQKWSLTARYCSFAHENVAIESAELVVEALNGAIACETSLADTSPPLPASIEPQGLAEAHFDVLTQKMNLDDRRSASLDLSLILKWRREGEDYSIPVNVTTLPISRLLVASSEPRVLASYESTLEPLVLGLKYVIENPSMHFLTFSAVMESSEGFAFEGPKSKVVQVLPLSKREVEYKIMPGVRGEWLAVNLVVTDRYFQKVLRVLPGEGLRVLGEKEGMGVSIWIPDDEEDDDE